MSLHFFGKLGLGFLAGNINLSDRGTINDKHISSYTKVLKGKGDLRGWMEEQQECQYQQLQK